jgi:zinc protease
MMRQIQRKYYLPNNAAVVVAGDVETAEIFRLAEKIFGDWPRGEDPFLNDPVPRHPPLERDAVAIVHQPVNAATIQFGYHGPSTDTDPAATYAADVFSFILRQPNSRFSRELIDSGLTTGASLSYYTQRNVGPIALMAQTNPDRLKEAITAINRQISLFTTPDYFTEEELESAKTLLHVNEIYDREKPSEYAHTVSFWWASTGLDYYETYVERLRRVTRADIARYVETYLWKKPRVVAVLLSESDHQRIGLREADLLVREPDLPAKKGREMRKGSRPGAPLP